MRLSPPPRLEGENLGAFWTQSFSQYATTGAGTNIGYGGALVERGIKVTTMTYYEGAYTLFMGYSHPKLKDVCRRLRFIGGWQVYQHPIFNWRRWPPYVLLFPLVSIRCLLLPLDTPNNTHTFRGLPFHTREAWGRQSWPPYSLNTPFLKRGSSTSSVPRVVTHHPPWQQRHSRKCLAPTRA